MSSFFLPGFAYLSLIVASGPEFLNQYKPVFLYAGPASLSTSPVRGSPGGIHDKGLRNNRAGLVINREGQSIAL
jgi:hypothetical protein